MRLKGRLLVLVGSVLALAVAPVPHAARAVEVPPAPPLVRPPPPPTPPPALVARLKALEAGWGSVVGIAVTDIQSGWVAESDGLVVAPQQSVSKLWVAMTVFDAVDHGLLHLDDPVTVGLGDMSVFNQPIQKRMVDGVYNTTIDGLLVCAIAESDNACNDMLVRRVGGSETVQKAIAARQLGAIRVGPEEKLLQAKIAGLEWRPEYSFGQAFWTARDAVPPGVRITALENYLASPDDGATAEALVLGLARLSRGELLSPASTARFLQILGMTETGPLRLKAGLEDGWTIEHKTGTGQDMADMTTGYNDVGIITAPDGHSYAVAVMMGETRRPIPERQDLMADVARAVVAVHDGRDPFFVPPPPAPPPPVAHATPHRGRHPVHRRHAKART